MNIATVAIMTAIAFVGCENEMYLEEPGNLVPKTVDLDPSLPSISANGTLLHAEAFGDPNDPMVIYLHGGPGVDYRNGLNIKQLVEDDFYVVFYDQRGSGLSPRLSRDQYTLELMTADLTAVIEHYRSSPEQKIFLFGHSWGAMLATAYVNENPASIDGLILAEPGGFTDEMVKEYGQLSRQLDLLAESSNNAVYLDQFLTGDANDDEILDYKLGLSASYTYSEGNPEGIEGPSPYWRKGAVILDHFTELAMTEGFDFTQNLQQFTPNILFIYSELNEAYSFEYAQELASYYSSAEILEIKGTGHEMIYFKWEGVHTPVLNYLNSLK